MNHTKIATSATQSKFHNPVSMETRINHHPQIPVTNPFISLFVNDENMSRTGVQSKSWFIPFVKIRENLIVFF